MRVADIEIERASDSCEVRAKVVSDRDHDHDDWFEPFSLWYRFPPWCAPFLSVDNGDPFLAALLLGAMRGEPRLAIAAPVSRRLLEALPEIQAIYAAFDSQARPIEVQAAARNHSLPTAAQPGVGLFFSLGVDSFYSLIKNEREHPADEGTVTHLLTIHGIDVPFHEWDDNFAPELLENATRVAAATGKTLLPVVTNVRRVTPALGPWPMLHGGGTIAAALALGAALRRVHIAASTTYDRLYPWGSHPILDRLWSTEDLAVVHDGCEMNTIDKTRYIVEARSELVLETVRPCAGYGPGYNCGACLKCMRTMIDLLQFGYLERCRTLPQVIDVERFREVLRPGGPVHVADYTRRLQALEAQSLAPDVQQVLREHLAQGMASKWYAATDPQAARQGMRGGFLELLRRRIGIPPKHI